MNNEDVLQELQALKTKLEQSENARSLAERKLKESEVQYQHLIEAGTALIWISDTDKLCTYFNNNWLQFTGRTLEQEVGNGWAEGVHPDDFDKCLDIYITSFDKREPFEMEYRLRHASGEYRWLLDIGTPNYSSTAEFIGYIGHCFDISERKKTEIALKESEEKYRSIFESIQDVYYEASFDGILLEVSPSIEFFTKGQYKREDVIGLSMASFYTQPSDRESSIAKLIEESSFRDYELSLSNKDGSVVAAAVSSALIYDDKGVPQKITGIIRDISERKMADNAIKETLNLLKEANQNLEKRVEERTEELRKSMIMQEAILQHAGLAIISTSADGIIEHFNKAAEEMLGYKAEEVIGKLRPSIFHLPEELESRVKEIDLENEGNAPIDFQSIQQALHSAKVNTKEWTFVHKNGRQFPVNLTLSSIKKTEGKSQGYIGIALDITKEKEAKKALQKSEADNRAIIQAVPDLMFRIHKDGTFLNLISTNEASLFVPKEAFIGKKINEVLPPVLAQKSLQVLELAFTSGEVEHFEYMLPVQNQNRYFENRITAISEHEVLSMIRDITERKEAENTIKLQTAAFESFANAIIITNIDGYIQWANSAFTHLTGYTFDEFIGKRPGELIKSGMQDADFYKTFWSTILEKKVWKGELINRRKDGTLYYEEEIITPVLDSEGNIVSFIAVKIDITDRKKIEEDFRESQEKYRGLSEASFEAIFFSEKGVCIEQNLAAEKMFGYTTEEALTRYGTDWIVPEDRQMVMDNMLSGIEKPYEATALRKDGTTFPCVLQGRMMRYKNKDVRVTSLNDITERKQIEAALSEIEWRFSLFMDYLPATVFIKDHEGRVLYVNKYMNETFGAYSWVGKTMAEIYPNELGERMTKGDLKAISNSYNKFEESVPQLDGVVHHFELQKFTINRPGKEPLLGGIGLDITERKQAENVILKAKEDLSVLVEERTADLMIAKNKAEESEQLYSLLIESIPNTSFFLFDKNLRFQIVGGEDIDKNGFNKAALIGKELPETLPQEVVDLLEPYYLSALQGKKNSFEWQFDNRAFFQQVLPIYNLNKEIFAGISISQDITERKQAEKSIIENQRLSAVGEMTSSIAHDFNNTLQAMKGNIEIIKFKENLSDSALGYINTIETLVTDVSSRVKLLQRFGDSKQNVIDHKLVNLNPIISEVVLQLRPMWKDRLEKEGHIIHINTSFCDSLPINCNEGEIKTAIHNILKNSIEAMPHGGNLSIKTKIKGQKALITFTDTGIGMNEEAKSKIFQPFFSTKGFEAGRGLGMSGVYSVVKSFGGNIQVVSSEIGQGTTIEIDFPFKKQQEISVATTQKEQSAKKNEKLHVLWVEDDDIIRESISQIIQLVGHQCDTASSGKLALEYLDKNTYDIVLTDIGMTEMTGWQLADAIKEKFKGTMPVCVVSGWQVTEEEKKEHGVAYSLDKPFTIAALNKLLFTFKIK